MWFANQVQAPHKRGEGGTVSDLVRMGTWSGAGPLFAACLGVCLAIFTPAATGAGAGAGVDSAPSAALELYALESELAAARTSIGSLAAQRTAVSRERASARRRLDAAQAALHASQRQLAQVVRALYVIGETDPLAELLGASSLDGAMEGIDNLERTASQSRAVSLQARSARAEVQLVASRLAERERRLAALEAEARRRAATLESAVDRKRAFLAELRRRESAARAATTARRAEEAQRRSVELTAAAAAAPVGTPTVRATEEVPEVIRGPRTLTVDAVAYSLPGRTASGLPVGRGVVAVDPAVIPLGTRMLVPGYGAGVAADVGAAVKGLIIDLWFPTLAEAQAWGRRTVTITLR
jgi:3D (Asp-Asp-Asp) domain-containing protein